MNDRVTFGDICYILIGFVLGVLTATTFAMFWGESSEQAYERGWQDGYDGIEIELPAKGGRPNQELFLDPCGDSLYWQDKWRPCDSTDTMPAVEAGGER